VGLNVLVVDRGLPVGLDQGATLIGHRIFSHIAKRHRLVLLSFVPRGGPDDEQRRVLDAAFDEVHLVPVEQSPKALGGWIDASLPAGIGARFRSAAYTSARFRATLRQLLDSQQFDAAHVRQLPMAPYQASIPRGRRLLELIDSEALATERDARSGRRAVRLAVARFAERRALLGADIATYVGEVDAMSGRQLAPEARVEVVPNGVDADYFQPQHAAVDSKELVFVGAMSFSPNVVAVQTLVHQILPLVKAEEPTIRLTIVGRDPTPEVRALADGEWVRVTGRVDDVRGYLGRAAMVVCPMQNGSGIKNKVLEAMASAKCVVASPLAVEGITTAPHEVAVGKDVLEMARLIIDLMRDPQRRTAMGLAARARVVRDYSWESCADRYAILYQELADGRPRAAA
jgi:glycosyltransferase involved in cell wall biosynthesis